MSSEAGQLHDPRGARPIVRRPGLALFAASTVLVAVSLVACGGQSGPELSEPITDQGVTVELLELAGGEQWTTVRVRFSHSGELHGAAPAAGRQGITADGEVVPGKVIEFDQVASVAVYRFQGAALRSVEFQRLLIARDGGSVALLDLCDLLPADALEALVTREFAVSAERELISLSGGPIVGAVGLGASGSGVPNRALLRLLSLQPFSGLRFAIVYSDGSVEQALFTLTATGPVSREQPNLFGSTVGFPLESHQLQLAGHVRIFRGPVSEWLEGNWTINLQD